MIQNEQVDQDGFNDQSHKLVQCPLKAANSDIKEKRLRYLRERKVPKYKTHNTPNVIINVTKYGANMFTGVAAAQT